MEANGFRFPLFVDLAGKKVVVVGGGSVACRRIKALLPFGAAVTVVSPALAEELPGVLWLARPYAPGDLAGATLAVAATDHRAVNRLVGEQARALGVPVSVADRAEECTFFFPALCQGRDVLAGVISRGQEHAKTARAAEAVRRAWEGLE